MNFAVSNIAWAPDQTPAAYALLQVRGVTGLEIAPGLFFAGAADVFNPTAAEARAALDAMAGAGLRLVSMQSLLFGIEGAALFGPAEARARFAAGMERAIRLAGRFGIPNLVFGSPRQRVIPDTLAPDTAMDQACATFTALGDLAAAHGTVIAMETNPAAYGTNFLTEPDQTQRFVDRLAHPAVRLCLDIGALHMTGCFDQVGRAPLPAAAINHVHVSEPWLAPAPRDAGQARQVLHALHDVGYQGWISIEMKAAPVEDGLVSLAAGLGRLQDAAKGMA